MTPHSIIPDLRKQHNRRGRVAEVDRRGAECCFRSTETAGV